MAASRAPSGSGFLTTHWSVVYAAQGESAEARAALEKICHSYWRPIYSFARRRGSSVEDAQDLTQSFFARLLERRDLDAVQREKGRLRCYLLVALKNFMAKERERASSQKRGGGRTLVSLDEILAHDRHDPEPAQIESADKIYERRWAFTLLEQGMGELENEYAAAEQGALFARFQELLHHPEGNLSQATIAAELGMSENAVKQAYLRFRRRYRELLRAKVAETVALPADVEDELRHLINILRS